VPVAYRVVDGNTPDDLTHIPTWDELRSLVGRADFLYVADSKLCSKQAMGHIATGGGRFVTVVPHGRREDTWFRDWAQTHAPAWMEAERRTGARLGDADEVWRVFEAPVPSLVRISLQSDHPFRSNPISRFGGFRSPAREAVSTLT
jgi:hypothetical protein